MCGSRAEVHNVVSMVTMDVAPEQGRKMDPLAPLTCQSAQLRSTETSREVAADHEAPSQTNAAAKAARALGGAHGSVVTPSFGGDARKPRRELAGNNAEKLRPG